MSGNSDLRDDLAQRFGTTPGCDDQFIEQCIGLCEKFGQSADDLYFKWESTIIARNTVGARYITKDTPSVITNVIQSSLKRAALAHGVKSESNARRGRLAPSGMLGLGSRMNARLSGVGLVNTTSASSPQSIVTRTIGKLGPSKVTFECRELEPSFQDKRDYKYMYEKISERSEALDERIDEFAGLIRKHYGLTDLGDPSASTDEAVVVVGRITLDAEASSGHGKLNEASVYIESSRMMGSGARVPLKFTPNLKIKGGPRGQGNVSLFPGAIVAVKGRNGGGGWFTVYEIMSFPPLASSATSVAQTGAVKQELQGAAFSMAIACGPYTQDSDLSYKPWSSLFAQIASQKPDVVFLIGPFVDSTNQKIKTGDTDQSPEDLFESQFQENLHDFLESSSHSLVLILPSVRDMTSHHNVYPQSPLNIPSLASHPRIKSLPNPCRFSLNGVTFAATSVDVLFHLRKEQLVLRAEEIDSLDTGGEPPATDVMAGLSRHILHQRSFYPLFPSPLDLSHEVNLDVTHLEHLVLYSEEVPTAPDVLITPSRLKQFSKVVDHTVSINPSFVMKNVSANLVYGGQHEGPVSSRIKVDVGKFSE